MSTRIRPDNYLPNENSSIEETSSPTFRKKPSLQILTPSNLEHHTEGYKSSFAIFKKSHTQNSIVSNGSKESYAALDNLINYLIKNEDTIASNLEILHTFETLTAEVLSITHDPEVYRLLRSNGWTGTRYRATEEVPLDVQSCIQSFSNWYLKQSRIGELPYIYNFFEKDSKLADQVFSFCPDTLLSILKKRTEALPLNPTSAGVNSSSFYGACMLADISGFTKFSSSMCRKGVRGLDDLREVTNGFLGYFVRIVYEHKGDVIAFAGDALICVFPDHDVAESTQGSIRNKASDSCLRAMQCACILRNHETQSLSAHLALSYGEMKFSLLGGLFGQWVYLMNGACISELSDCIDDARSKEVVCTSSCLTNALSAIKSLSKNTEVSSILKVRPCGSSNNILVESINWVSNVPTPACVSQDGHRKDSRSSRYVSSSTASTQVVSSASLFIPKPISTAISTDSLEHVGEFRQVTTMFLSLDSYSSVSNQDPTTLQPFFLIAQEVLHESGGFLRQFLVDDKGCVLIAMWGIPSFTYSNNCSRALFCAVSISMRAKEIGHTCSVGVTTGNVFCGIVGAPERRDYAGIGSDVNMAARLMSKANERILVDETTYNNLSQTTQSLLAQAEEMQLKGRDKPVVPYKYNSDSVPHIAAVDEQFGRNIMLKPEVTEELSLQLDSTCNGFSTFSMVIGPPGTAKSAAAAYFRKGAMKRLMQCVSIHAQRGHDGVPYGVMKELFLKLVGEKNFAALDQQKTLMDMLLSSVLPEADVEEINSARKSLLLMLGIDSTDFFASDHVTVKSKSTAEDHDHSIESINYMFLESNEKSSTNPPANARASSTTPNRTRSDSYDNSSLDDNSNKLVTVRRKDDQIFFKVLRYLLVDTPTAIIIEYAHYCDELSWEELNHLLGGDLRVAVLITMENKFQLTTSPSALDKSHAVTPNTNQTRKRQSVLSPTPHLSPRAAAAETPRGGAALLPSPWQSNTQNLGGKSLSSVSNTSNTAQQEAPPAYLAIVNHPNTKVLELTSLNDDEVKQMLLKILNVNTISSDVVKLVLDVSSGNAFWCKAIANFIKERGMKELDTAVLHGSTSENNPLKVLILLRLEKLKPECQLIIKYASIIGEEFSEKMLAAVLPSKTVPSMPEALKRLVEDGLITPLEEYPEAIYEFQNKFIKDTFYTLMPPSDAATIHLKVAEFLEVEYANKLRPLYPILGHHYKNSLGKRHLAFKYEVKAADQAICRGAYNDGLKFVDMASNLAVNKSELKVLIAVISRALDDLSPQLKIGNGKTRRLSFNRGKALTNTVAAYMQLKINAEAALGKVSKTVNLSSSASIRTTPASGVDELTPLPASNRILVSRQPSAKLTWEPSYVAARNNSEINSQKVKPNLKSEKSNCAVS